MVCCAGEAPPSFHSPSQDVDSLSGGEGRMSGLVIVVVTVVGMALLMLNVLLVGCCLHRRANKRLTGEGDRTQIISNILSKADTPRLIIIGVAVTGTLLVLINVALVICFIYRKRNRRLKEATSEQSSSKSATIEMYAPSSYNETVTGETLSSVSEKSESYSNGDSNQEYLEDGTKAAASTYLIDQVEYPYPYPTYEMQHQPKHHEEVDNLNRNTYNHTVEGNISNFIRFKECTHICVERERERERECGKQFLDKTTLSSPNQDSNLNIPIIGRLVHYESSALDYVVIEADCKLSTLPLRVPGGKLHYGTLPPPHQTDGPYYNISPDARYIPYPPQMEFSHLPTQQPPNTGSLRRPQHRVAVVPPDVTVSHNPPLQNGPPPPLLSTFNPSLSYPLAMETEGHLVECTHICVERERERERECGKQFLDKTTLSSPNQDSNLNIPIIGRLVHYESSALDYVVIEADCKLSTLPLRVPGGKLHYGTLPPPHQTDGPYYNISPDARYIPYPPQMEFSHLPTQQPPNTGSLRRPQHRVAVVPPDVTVSHNPPLQNGPPPPLLSTFNPSLSYPLAMETEGHLV
ncbi:unnamed protein product [Timema podura]|uniref:Uncharacterized protein n=1 Tax=Timema podura TaxID=61482 RepID=A0ABN7NDY5_TIMPD|nr:unnamed protein product [Timema podura]